MEEKNTKKERTRAQSPSDKKKRGTELRKRQLRRNLLIGGGAGAVLLLVLLAVLIIPRLPKSAPAEDTEVLSALPADPSDTAIRQTVPLTVECNTGWNITEGQWWYVNADRTQYVNGWKVIDGQKYYFRDNGYLATGWTNTGDGGDSFFDPCGMYEPETRQKLVALTYDDGPAASTESILDTLEAYNAKATFFVVGTQAEYYSDLLAREHALGMEIGNHTYNHETLSLIDTEDMLHTIEKNQDLVEDQIGFTMELLRPTGGGMSDAMLENITMPMMLWDVDTLDWETRDPDATYQEVMNNVRDGSVVLMHDLFSTAAEATKMIVPTLQSMGYRFVTLSELAETYGYTLEGGQVYYAFYPENSPNPTEASRYAVGQ